MEEITLFFRILARASIAFFALLILLFITLLAFGPPPRSQASPHDTQHH